MKIFENFDFSSKISTFEDFKLSFSREDIPERYKQKIMEAADLAAATDIPMTPAKLYREFVLNGNRTRYEAPYFLRRDILMKLTVGEYTFDDGRYIDALIDCIWAICEETSWVLPAHNRHMKEFKIEYQLPMHYEDDVFLIDLFSAQTGAQLAFAWYLFRDKLEAACPDTVVRRMEYELNRQIFHPFEKNYKEFHWSGAGGNYVNNWNPWILSNILTTVALFERNQQKREEYTELCCHLVDNYIKRIPSDGSCDEGMSYWSMSCGTLFNFLEVLSDISGGKISVANNELFRKFAEYIIKMHVAGIREYVTFNDCSRYKKTDSNMFWRMGKLTNSELMLDFAGQFAPVETVNFVSSMPYCGLKNFVTNVEKREFAHEKTYYMDKIQIMTARNTFNGKKVFVCAKAGANNEGHGHLDDGSFVLYVDENPVFIDVGVQAYTKDTFSKNRFKNWSIRSLYHNTVSVDDIEQGNGGAFKTTDVVCENGVLSFELKNTFANSDGIVSIKRCIDADCGFTVTDEYEFETEREYKFNLMSAAKPVLAGNTLTVKTPYGTTVEFEISDGYSISYEEIREKSRAIELWDTDCIYRTVISKKAKLGKFVLCLK